MGTLILRRQLSLLDLQPEEIRGEDLPALFACLGAVLPIMMTGRKARALINRMEQSVPGSVEPSRQL